MFLRELVLDFAAAGAQPLEAALRRFIYYQVKNSGKSRGGPVSEYCASAAGPPRLLIEL